MSWSSGRSSTGSGGGGESAARFRSEMYVPVTQGGGGGDAGQTTSSSSWQTMHDRLDERRRQWNDEVSRSPVLVLTGLEVD